MIKVEIPILRTPPISVADAQQRILDAVTAIPDTETISIANALGRVLAQPAIAQVDVPGFDNSAMDGYALSSQHLATFPHTQFTVIGTSFAGTPYQGKRIQKNECVRIMTGALLAEGCDCVVMQERVQRNADNISIQGQHCAGDNIRYRGDDTKSGSSLLRSGKKLQAADIALLASAGVAEVLVKRRLRVGFFSTGDELRSIGSTLQPGQIYDSNRYLLAALLAQLGVESIDLGVIKDDKEILRSALVNAAQQCDALITSGGVSVGEADYVKQVLEETGQVDFWRVAMKPGKPLAIGKIGHCRFFGLPGNPVSVFATYYIFVQEALRKMMGAEPRTAVKLRARCQNPLKKAQGRAEFQRGKLSYSSEGVPQVISTGGQGSHLLHSISDANCFIVLPQENTGVQMGDWVEVMPFYGLV